MQGADTERSPKKRIHRRVNKRAGGVSKDLLGVLYLLLEETVERCLAGVGESLPSQVKTVKEQLAL